MKNKYIICAYSCIGKTYFKDNFNIKCLEYPIGSFYRQHKNLIKDLDIIIENHYKNIFDNFNDILLMIYPSQPAINLYKSGYPVKFFLPKKEILDKYLLRYLERGKEFEYELKKKYMYIELEVFYNLAEKDSDSFIFLDENQYLSDVIYDYLSDEDKKYFCNTMEKLKCQN